MCRHIDCPRNTNIAPLANAHQANSREGVKHLEEVPY